MRARGNLSIEFVVGIIFLVFTGLGVFDLSAVLLALQLNDALCTEASQMAASGPPEQVFQRANVVVARAKKISNWFISSLSMGADPKVTLSGPSPDVLKSTGGSVTGMVSVCTKVQVRLPVLGAVLNGAAPSLQTTRTSPFRYSYPAP